MPLTHVTDSSLPVEGECRHLFLGKGGPTVRILLYTDDPLEVTDDALKNWSLGIMLLHIRAHAPAFANLCFNLVSRNSSRQNHADNRLDDLIAKGNYDQIWFFGTHQGNRENFSMEVLRGGPQSELDEKEVKALENWMRASGGEGQRGGGVLMTGDHAEPRPPDGLPALPPPPPGSVPKEEFWGLGRALGRHVPRAGQMRSWEGPPTRRAVDNQNTQVLTTGTNFDDDLLQFDPIPQRLKHVTFDTKGEPAAGGRPHPLFFYRQGTFIHVYPDHMHEGTVIIPKDEDLADKDVWPNGQLVRPRVVARGTDNSKARDVDLIAAYNGDRADVGRIVADSTWHHYFNINLHRFIPPGDINTPTDQIGQYYGNLAVWLTPLAKRREMARAMIRWVATHPVLLEERVLEELSDDEWSSVLEYLGERAYYLLSQVASQCEIHELLNALLPDEVRANVETLYLPEKGFALGSFGSVEFLLPSKELLLGSFTNQYHREVARAESSGAMAAMLEKAADSVTTEGFDRALRVQRSHVTRLASASVSWFQV